MFHIPGPIASDDEHLNFSQQQQQLSASLVDRISCQRGRSVLDLSLCSIARAPIPLIETYYGPVKALDLSYNHIRKLAPEFALKLSTLTKLDLSRNELKRLPDNFGRLENLEYLDVQKNQLKTLPVTMGKMKRLQYLNVRENQFKFPLCDFLETDQLLHSNLESANSAEVVVGFFEKLLQETFPAGSHAFQSQGTHEAELSDNSLQWKPTTSTRQRDIEVEEKVGTGQLRAIGYFVFFVGIVLFPLIPAHFYGTSYLDYVFSRGDSIWSQVWAYYKPAHEYAEFILDYLKLTGRIFSFGNPPTPPSGNIFYQIYKWIFK